MHPAIRLLLRLWACLALAMLAATLSACGGGDCDTPDCTETLVPTPGVDCKARPELCK